MLNVESVASGEQNFRKLLRQRIKEFNQGLRKPRASGQLDACLSKAVNQPPIAAAAK